MKVQIICEKCNNIVELTPKTNGMLSDMGEIRDYFSTNESIEVNLSDSLDTNFVNSLVKATTDDEVVDILENDIADNVDIDEKLNELRIDCKSCGSYIVLNNF